MISWNTEDPKPRELTDDEIKKILEIKANFEAELVQFVEEQEKIRQASELSVRQFTFR
ncbi:MAG: hypothetical protein N2450_06850 [bacterium]|nr:hypothetical protein [bacterium]